MVGAFHSPEIADGDLDRLITTRVEIIGEMSEDHRRTMMISRIMALKDVPQLEEADQQVTTRVLPIVSESARLAFTSTMADLKQMAAS